VGVGDRVPVTEPVLLGVVVEVWVLLGVLEGVTLDVADRVCV
jgi:hypothetical protein